MSNPLRRFASACFVEASSYDFRLDASRFAQDSLLARARQPRSSVALTVASDVMRDGPWGEGKVMVAATNKRAWRLRSCGKPQSNPQPWLQTWIRFLPRWARALLLCEASHGGWRAHVLAWGDPTQGVKLSCGQTVERRLRWLQLRAGLPVSLAVGTHERDSPEALAHTCAAP